MKTETKNTTQGKFSKFLLVFTLTLAISASTLYAQNFKAVAGTEIKVDGTSNLHDWTMKASGASADAQLVLKGNDIQDINALNFSLTVNTLKSKEDLMDTRAYKALKEDQHKKITFKLSSATVDAANNVKANGTLTISGVSKEVVLLAKTAAGADGSISFVGNKKIKMSEFGIKPPSFMMGALKVGDEVTINYNLKLKR